MINTRQLANQPAVLDVLILGAGFGGVCAAIKLRERGIDNIRIFEKAAGIGGTWWHNTYPGAACDIPSHLYCYSFEPNPNWSRKFSPQPEIQAYIERCTEKYDVKRHIQVSESAHKRYNADIRTALQNTVWAGDCLSWYKRADGEIASLYPYNARTFLKDHKHLVSMDFDVKRQ
jgi:cation diffusion facilitator CzcD-associated flavoprotein CzcO